MKTKILGLLAVGMLAGPIAANAAPINVVPYGSLTGTELITFDDVAGGPAPGTKYDGIFESGNTAFAERFVGQVNTPAGTSDVLSGSPSGPLTLAVGAAGRNLGIYTRVTNVLYGLGPLGFPDFEAIGEGSFALLFDFDQSEFGFELVGGNGGNAYVNFFRRDGSLIDSLVVGGLSDDYYGFAREGGVRDIAGISIHNDDLGGIGLDDLKHDVRGVPDDDVPEPASLALLGLGLLGLGLSRRRKA